MGSTLVSVTLILFAADHFARRIGWTTVGTRLLSEHVRFGAIERLAPIGSQWGDLELGDHHPDERGQRHLPGREVHLVQPDFTLVQCIDLGDH